ncbi:MAG: Mur ligase family protein, partial [Bacteroidota bacterium]
MHNIQALAQELGDPHHQFPSIHVAGTNGKGSSCHMLAAILQSAGYTCGLYTSPHLWSFRERIRINGQPIPENEVLAFVNMIKASLEKMEPSFFEITVALAFYYFAKKQVDIAIIEVGLGGRLDSTNIINPLVSLITNISLDHQAVLGNDLASIAGEKAGIIKKGKPVIIGEYHLETYPVFSQKAEEASAPLFMASDTYKVIKMPTEEGLQVWKEGEIYFDKLMPDLKGDYQLKNLPGVLSVIDCMNDLGWKIEVQAQKKGLEHTVQLTGLRGRWETLNEQPRVICDTAHNIGALKTVFEQVNALKFNNLHIITALSKDKDIKN